MKRCFWNFLILICTVICVQAQTPLEFFTNEANGLLQAQFGFGVANIPVYCPTNPAVGYSSSVHYVLQSTANSYDATTPATDLPSVFRPLFSWQSNTLFIVGYAGVTHDFYTQTRTGFKTLGDPTITTNDNVWGIPWVIGAKGQIPAFNNYCYCSDVSVQREIEFLRYQDSNGVAETNRPPHYTNVIYIMSISNLCGADAWNFYPATFNRSVTIVVSNQLLVTFTNEYNAGTNWVFNSTASQDIESWPGWPGGGSTSGFIVPLMTNLTSVPTLYWSELAEQFVPWNSGPAITNYLTNALQRTGGSLHQWTLNITNNFMYALMDNVTGRVLDFVNLGGTGSSMNVTSVLPDVPGNQNVWEVFPATDAPNSPFSYGVLNQIVMGIAEDPAPPRFFNSLRGSGLGYPAAIESFDAPFSPYANVVQGCSWHAQNPLVHYTVEDLVDPRPGFNQTVTGSPLPILSLGSLISNSVWGLGRVSMDYTSSAPNTLSYNLSNGSFQISFQGTADLPYAVWGSTNLMDWSQVGTVAQPAPGVFQFQDPAAATYPNRFYHVQLP